MLLLAQHSCTSLLARIESSRSETEYSRTAASKARAEGCPSRRPLHPVVVVVVIFIVGMVLDLSVRIYHLCILCPVVDFSAAAWGTRPQTAVQRATMPMLSQWNSCRPALRHFRLHLLSSRTLGVAALPLVPATIEGLHDAGIARLPDVHLPLRLGVLAVPHRRLRPRIVAKERKRVPGKLFVHAGPCILRRFRRLAWQSEELPPELHFRVLGAHDMGIRVLAQPTVQPPCDESHPVQHNAASPAQNV